jgi:DNA-binding transcriptional MerR regulator
MSVPTPAPARKYIAKRRVAERYDVTIRTVDRWVEKKVIPPPDLDINNRGYWYEDGLDRHDRQCVAERAK